jgi:NADPH2:quinone reductase
MGYPGRFGRVPQVVRAQQLQSLDGPASLRLVDIDEPDDHERVIIDVAIAGVSFPDLLLSRGLYQMKPPLPFVPGVEVAGTVHSAPSDSQFVAGDRVMAFTMLGGFAERVSADAALTVRLPAGLSMEAAGGFLMNYHTAHFALARRGRVRPGETVAVHGAAGGVGTAALQVARALGAHPVALCSSADKGEIARQAGAEAVIDTSGDWTTELRSLNGGRGADVILDPVGGDRFDQSLKCLVPEGRIIVVGFTEGRIPTVQVNRLLFRNIDVIGAAWGAFLAVEPGLFAATQEALNPMIAAGDVSPIVGHALPLEQAPKALQLLEDRRAMGKIVLTV